MSPPEAPMPDTAFGCPRYSRPQPDAPVPPIAPRPRQNSLPPPRPFSEPRNTLFARDTWMAGSPALFVPQPVAPTAPIASCPNEKLPAVSVAALRRLPHASLVTSVPAAMNPKISTLVAAISERVHIERRTDTPPPLGGFQRFARGHTRA